jgi:hypothetical protein
MRNVSQPFRQQVAVAGIVSTLILAAAEQHRYEVAHEGGQPQMNIIPEWWMETVLSVSAKSYPSDPLTAEFIHLKGRFDNYVSEWRKARNPLSSNAWDNVFSPGYQKLIGMGPAAVPLILEELRRELKTGEPDDWFVALWAITDGENPVPLESRGKLREMAVAWLEWGSRQEGLNGEELGASVPALG